MSQPNGVTFHPNFKLNDPSLLCQTGWIDGKPHRAISQKEPFPVYDPSTDECWAYQEDMEIGDVDIAIASATKAFPGWSKTASRQRARLLLNLDRIFREAKPDIAQLLVLECGKTLDEAEAEVDYAASYTWLMAGECERISGEIISGGEDANTRYMVTHHPIGPVALLNAWNFPMVLAVRKISTALAAGCTAVVKASPETPITTSAFAMLCTRAGIPDGVVNVISSSNAGTPAIGKKLCEDSRIKKISFTGSTPVGKLLMAQSSGTLKKLTLELGGNSGWIVFDDADLEKAATALVANKFRSAGQVCICANRTFVHRPVLNKFVNLLERKIAELKFGHGLDAGVTNGPLTTKRGAERASELVKDAVSRGAKLVTGGKPFGKGYHFEPTLLVEAEKTAMVYTEEMFAPICSVYAFDTEDEVIALCNDTSMGLANYVFTSNLSRAWRCSDELQSGTVAINTMLANSAEAPFGGMKESGFGKEGGFKYGVEEFCVKKSTTFAV